jgi:hypothetical protein
VTVFRPSSRRELVRLPTKSIVVAANDSFATARNTTLAGVRMAAVLTWFVTVTAVRQGMTAQSRGVTRVVKGGDTHD